MSIGLPSQGLVELVLSERRVDLFDFLWLLLLIELLFWHSEIVFEQLALSFGHWVLW